MTSQQSKDTWLNKHKIQLINAVKKCPGLYIRTEERRKPKKLYYNQCWNLIAAEMKMDVEICKVKWKTIRDNYSRCLKKYQQTGKWSVCLEDESLKFLSDCGMQSKSDNLSEVVVNKSEDSLDKQETTTTILTQDMIESMLKNKEKELSSGVDVKDINVISIVNGVMNSFESLLLRKQIDEMTRASAAASDVNKSVANVASNPHPFCSVVNEDNEGTDMDITKNENKSNLNIMLPNNNTAATFDLEGTSETSSYSSDSEIEDKKSQITIYSHNSRKRKHSDPGSSSSCSEISDLADKEKNVSLLDVDCNEKDMKTFFNNLADYVTNRFSEEKQMEIRLRICSMLTHAEIDDLKLSYES